MKRRGLLLVAVGVIAVAAACTELVTSPGKCPDYCPGGKIVTVESLLTDAIKGDSSYTGYWLPSEVTWLVAEDFPGQLDSRPFFQMAPISPRMTVAAGDTQPIIVDSV